MIIAGVSKGGFGGGGVFAATPILALASSPQIALGVLLPIFCLMDSLIIWQARKGWDRSTTFSLLIGGSLGVGLGWLSFGMANEAMLKLLLGLISLGFLALQGLRLLEASQLSDKHVTGLGIAAGFTSFVAHAGSPLVTIALLSRKLSKHGFHTTAILFFGWVNFIKLPSYAQLGLLSSSNLTASAWLAPVAILSVWLGFFLHNRISNRWFYYLIHGLLFIIGIKLVFDGFKGL